MNAFDPTYLQRDDGADGVIPSREDLWQQYLKDGDLDAWADAMNALYPLTEAEIEQALEREGLR